MDFFENATRAPLSMEESRIMVKDAELSADALSPLIGAAIGGGLGYVSDKLRPIDEDENKWGRRLSSILAGAAMGGLAGHGMRQFAHASPMAPQVFDKKPDPVPKSTKGEFNPSWNSALGTALVSLPLILLARGRLKALKAANPAKFNAVIRGIGKATAATSIAAGGAMVARNQFRKDASDKSAIKEAQMYSAPSGTDRNNVRYGLSKATRDSIYADTRYDMGREADRARSGSSGLTWQGFVDPVTGEFRMPVSWGSTKANISNSSLTPTQANFVSLLTKNKGLRDHRQLTSAMDSGGGGRTWRTAAGAAMAALPLLLLGRGKIRNLLRGRPAPKGGALGRLFRRAKTLGALGTSAAGAGLIAYDRSDKGSNGLEFMRDPSVVNLHRGTLTRHGMDDLKFAFRHVYGRDPNEFDMANLNRRMEGLLGTHAGANGNPYRFEKYLPRTF